MKLHLKDIIDLDYLISRDEKINADDTRDQQTLEYREMIKNSGVDDTDSRALIMTWLDYKRRQFYETGGQDLRLLPGETFHILYRWMVYLLLGVGFISGGSVVYSFLAYHGVRPVNVTIFLSFFVLLPLIFFLVNLSALILQVTGASSSDKGQSLVQSVLIFLFFNWLPRVLKKLDKPFFKKGVETFDYTRVWVRQKHIEYKEVIYWPLFILPSVFAFAFSLGSLCATFFKVLTSDMAFGWQSTLLTESPVIHKLIAKIALPWSWIVGQEFAYPSLAQIEGTKIILKESINTLTTNDLVSWWPFLCLSILTYAVLPRVLLIITGVGTQIKTVSDYPFDLPKYRKLILRLQTPVMDVRFQEERTGMSDIGDGSATEKETVFEKNMTAEPGQPYPRALLLVSKRVYDEKSIRVVSEKIRQFQFLDADRVIDIDFRFDNDKMVLENLDVEDEMVVIFLYEVWQPPIKGLLHYFKQVKEAFFNRHPVTILLTQNPQEDDLGVDHEDMNFKVWTKVVKKAGDPNIEVQRLR